MSKPLQINSMPGRGVFAGISAIYSFESLAALEHYPWGGHATLIGNQSLPWQSTEALARKEKLHREGWGIEKLVERVCEIYGIRKEDIVRRGKQNKISEARSLVAYWSRKELGVSGSELASYFGITKQSVSEAVVRGELLARAKAHYLAS